MIYTWWFFVKGFNKQIILSITQNLYKLNIRMVFFFCQEILKHHPKMLLTVAVRRRHINILHWWFHFYDIFVKKGIVCKKKCRLTNNDQNDHHHLVDIIITVNVLNISTFMYNICILENMISFLNSYRVFHGFWTRRLFL